MPKAKFAPKRALTEHALYSKTSQKAFISQTNKMLEVFTGEMNELKLPDFGSSLYASDNSSCVFHNANTIVAATIADRISNKFERPNFAITNTLKGECNDDWVSFEERLRGSRLTINSEFRGNLIRGGYEFKQILKTDKQFLRSVWEQEPNFGPGESFITSQGDVSLFTKLNDLSKWTVTKDCAPLAALVISSNRGFREILKEKFFNPLKYKRGYRKPRVQLRDFKGYPNEIAYFAERVLHEFFLSDYGLEHLVQHGARGSSVYKNCKVRRFINIECLWNVVVQQMVGKSFRSLLKKSNNDLKYRQMTHRKLISQSDVSTLDWRSASDSNRTDRLKLLMSANPGIFKIADAARSHFVMISHEQDGQHFKAYHPIEKFSSMGNGFTFELLSLTIFAMARVHDKTASVYGDDLICSNQAVDKVVESVEAAGFTLNPKKSFIKVPLKESCGAFHLDGFGYITCYDIKWCATINDAFLTINKIGRILEGNVGWNHPLRDKLLELHGNLLALVNPCYMGPRFYKDDLPAWVEVPNSRTRQMRSRSCKPFNKERKLASILMERWKRDDTCCVTLIPELPKFYKIKACRNSDVKSLPLIYAYVKNGTVSDMMMRNNDPINLVTFVKHIIDEEGNAIRVATARKIISDDLITIVDQIDTKDHKL